MCKRMMAQNATLRPNAQQVRDCVQIALEAEGDLPPLDERLVVVPELALRGVELLALLTHLPDEARTVLVLGHAPGIPALANTIASKDGPRDMAEALDRGFPTTTLCRFEVEGDWLGVGAATADLVDVVVRQD